MVYVFPLTVFGVVIAVLAIATFSNFELDNYHYDRLKWIVMRWAYLVTFIGVIVKTLNVPYGVETVTLVAGFGAMLAGLLGISASNYYGEVEDDDEIDELSLDEEEGEIDAD